MSSKGSKSTPFLLWGRSSHFSLCSMSKQFHHVFARLEWGIDASFLPPQVLVSGRHLVFILLACIAIPVFRQVLKLGGKKKGKFGGRDNMGGGETEKGVSHLQDRGTGSYCISEGGAKVKSKIPQQL